MAVHAFTSADALGDLDAVGVAELIKSGDVSAREMTQAAIARAVRVNPQLNGIQLATFEQALKDSDRPADAAQKIAPFSGVPTFIKDNTDVAGLPSNQGSRAVNGRPADDDSPFTKQFLAQGFTVLGKSTMPEFGFNASTEYQGLPPTRNPWNTDYSSGASSGGAAALVAAGVVPIAHANDGGGSIRIPAAACGLVGLKVTRGRVVDAPEAKTLPINIISNGVVTRSVRDTAQFVAAAEQFYFNPRFPKVGLVEGPAVRRLRIGIVLDSVTGQATDNDTRAAVQETGLLLEKLGHTVVEAPLPVDEQFIDDFVLYWGMLAFGARNFGKKIMSPDFDKSRTDALTNGLSGRFRRRAHKLPGAIRRLKKSEQNYAEAFAEYDMVMSPTLGHATPKLGHLSPDEPFETLLNRLIPYVAFTPLNNTAGSPAISLPLGTSSEGMPIGVHFSAKHGDERSLLEVAFELESTKPFARIQG
ncbi:MAG: amidase [Aeromicrobium sp.]